MEFHFTRFGSTLLKDARRAACLLGLAALPAIGLGQTNFGSVNVGSSATAAVTVTLQSAGTLGSIAVLTKGAPNLDFTDAGGDSCTTGTAYAVGATCTVHVTFKPRFPGTRYGATELLSASGALLAAGYLQGTGVGPQVILGAGSESVVRGEVYAYAGPALDGSGNLFITDGPTCALTEVLAAGGYTTVNTLDSGFTCSGDIALDGAGNVYAPGANSVSEVLAASGYTTVISLGSGFSSPYGIAVDGRGNVFVADSGNNEVKEILAVNGSIPASPTILSLGSGFNSPKGVAVDGSGNVFVADGGNNALKEMLAVNGSIPVSPTILTLDTGGGYNNPTGPYNVAVDGVGNVFEVDTYGVDEFLAAGGYTTARSVGSGLLLPSAVAVDASGNVFVADAEKQALFEFDYADPPSLSFGAETVGMDLNGEYGALVANNGNAPLIFPVPTTGDNPSLPEGFAWDKYSTCVQTTAGSSTPFTLAAGESCSLGIDFDPTTVGSYSGSAVLTNNNLNVASATQAIPLTGTGIAPVPTVSLSATSLSYPATGIGEKSSSQSVTLTNAGTAALSITSIAVTGADASSFVFANNCGTSLAIGAKCTIHGVFAPAITGAATAAVTITDNAAGSPQAIALSGASGPSLSANSLSFGSVAVGESSASQTVILANNGNTALAISNIVLSGEASQFVFANNCGTSLAAGANCSIHGHFAPTAIGNYSATISIFESASSSPLDIALTGIGGLPTATLSQSSLAFGSIDVGSWSDLLSVTVSNSGLGALSISSIALSGTGASQFVFANNCGTSVAAGGSCSIHGHFQPTSTGPFPATITITDDAGNSPQSIAVTGFGVEPSAVLSATSIAFGTTVPGYWSASQSVTLSNPGTGPLLITSIAVTGADAAQFVFANDCGTSLTAHTNCTIHGHFQPTVSGAQTATVTITDNASGSPQSIALSGTGSAATGPVTLTPTSLKFGATDVGVASASQYVTMTNTGSTVLTISSIAVTGADGSSFVFGNSCGTSLAAGASCAIHGHFEPAATGALTAAVTITDSATGSPQSIALSGTGQ